MGKVGFWLSLVPWGVLLVSLTGDSGWVSVPRGLVGPLMGGSAVLALAVSVAAWRKGIDRSYAIAGTLISGAALVALVLWVA